MKAFMLVGLLLVGAASLVADEADKAVGYWKSISDVKGEEGKVTAIWKLGVDASGVLSGTIVDVGNNKADVYGCEIHVIEGGKKLDMRGYIGFAFIGRSQIWQTISEEETKSLIAN